MPALRQRTTLAVAIMRKDFLANRQARTFADVLNDPDRVFGRVLDFFNPDDRQRRMEESEIHHNRPALAGVVRESNRCRQWMTS